MLVVGIYSILGLIELMNIGVGEFYLGAQDYKVGFRVFGGFCCFMQFIDDMLGLLCVAC